MGEHARLSGARRKPTAIISTQPTMRCLLLLAVLCSGAPAWGSACVRRSGEQTAALVELYTAQRCSGCPAAERWLSELNSRTSGPVVAVSVHVDAWEYLGSKNRHAAARFSGRERRLLLLQRTALVYRPQVVLQGREFPEWASSAFDAALGGINGRRSAARLSLEVRGATPRGILAVVEGQILDAAQLSDAALYLAAVQDDPGSRERRSPGHVILEWQGPLAAGPDGRFAETRRLELLPTATPETSGVAAFVQNRRTGEVLQALLLASCSP
jgi:hypothetical protein